MIVPVSLAMPVPAAARNRSNSRLARNAARCLLLSLVSLAAAQAQNLTTFGTATVGTTTPVTQTVTVPIKATGSVTVASVAVLTMGAPKLDFTAATGGTDTCTNQTFSGTASCQYSVSFAPIYPGPRNGAVVLEDASGNPLATEYLTGTGEGSLAIMVPGTISVAAGVVGQWTNINDGAAATAADLYLPSGVALDGAGDIFIADSNHNRVREVVAATGDIQTVAGNGESGYVPTATIAKQTSLTIPGGVAIDGAGNLYIADTDNNIVREVNLTTGSIVTLAGNGQPGYTGDGDLANSANTTLNSPEGITVDAAGNLFIADTGNNVIREVNASTGIITTIAGGGATPDTCTGSTDSIGDGCTATSATLSAPYGVAFDPSGNMYIPDSGNNRVRVVSASHIITTFAGTGAAGYSGDTKAAAQAELYSPFGVACDAAGDVYIADAQNHVIRKVNGTTHIISTVAGNNTSSSYNDGKSGYTYGNNQSGELYTGNGIAAGASAKVTGAGINAPYAVALDGAGNIYVAEYFDNVIREVIANDATLFFTPALWEGQVSGAQNEYIENDGNQSLTFSGISNDANSTLGTGSTCSTTGSVAVDDFCSVQVYYSPTASGNPLVGNISLATAQPNSPFTIAAVGQALAQNTPVVSVTSAPNPSNYGTNVNFTVTVAKSPTSTEGTPSGNVTLYDLFPAPATPPTVPNPPSTPPGVVIGTASLGASGTAIISDDTLAVGTHDIYAAYGGNTYYVAANTSAALVQQVNEQVVVTVANTSLNNPSLYGQAVTFSATVTVSGNVPFGTDTTVTFYDGATVLGTGTLNASGVATFTTSTTTPLPLGKNSITATYTDTNNVTGTSTPLIQVVQQNTSTVVTSNPNPSTYGQAVVFTATVTATGIQAPTGTVTFYDGTTKLGTDPLVTTGTTAAAATLSISTLAVGTHSITAVYNNDANDVTSTSPIYSQVVNDASTATALIAAPNPATAGTQVTFTATVTVTSGGTSIPTGTVNFYNNGTTLLGSGKLNASGVATFSTSTLAVGSYSITAGYQGDANNDASTSTPPLAFSVVAATTQVKLTASATAIAVSTPVTFTATVTGSGSTPTGNVTFYDGTTSLGTSPLNASGVATLTTTALPLGAQTITATYNGDANNGTSTSNPVTVTVGTFTTQTTLAASAANVASNQPVVLLATVVSASGQPVTGTVTFYNGTTAIGAPQTVGANGSASLTIDLTAGSDTVTAKYSGDTDDAPSTSNSVTVTVSQATDFILTVSPTSVSIPTKDYANVNVSLASEEGFTDTISLGCNGLPVSVTCSFSNDDPTLSANGNASVVLTVDTNSPLAGGSQARNEFPGSSGRMLAAFVFPGSALFGFVFWRFRRRTGVLKLLVVLAFLTGTTFLMTGCAGFSLNSAAPGTYTIQVVASGQKTGVTHVSNITVQVTQ